VNNAFEAYASNPRYAEGGLESEIEREEMETARKMDVQSAAAADLEAMKPKAEPESDLYGNIRSIAETAIRVPQNVAAGMSGAIENTLALAVGRENINQANEWMKAEMPDWYNGMVEQLQPKGAVDEVTQELTKFIIPFGLAMKGAKAASIAAGTETGVATNALIAEVVASGAALDPHMERLSSFAKELGVENQIIGWLADNENETESEGRIKNIIEGAGITGALALSFKSAAMTFKGLRRFKEFGAANLRESRGAPVSGSPRAQRGSLDLGKNQSEIAVATKGDFAPMTIKAVKDSGYEKMITESGDLKMYHGTSSANAKSIKKSGEFKGHPFFTFNKAEAEQYSKQVGGKPEIIEVIVDPDTVVPTGGYFTARMEGLKAGDDGVYRFAKKQAKTPKPKSNETQDMDNRMDNIINELKNL